MLKLIKHEYRKIGFALGIILLSFLILEAMLGIGFAMNREELIVIAFALIFAAAFAAVLYMLFAQPVNFARELGSKSGYLVFMTPNSAYRIIGAKVLTALSGASIIGAGAGLLQMANYEPIRRKFALDTMSSLLDYVLQSLNLSVSGLVSYTAYVIIEILISCVVTASFAILAVSLSATLLHRNKGRTVISVILFLVLTGVMSWISTKLPGSDIYSGKELQFLLAEQIPRMIFESLCAVCAWLASAWLAEHKIAL